jgi:hypothetical protein
LSTKCQPPTLSTIVGTHGCDPATNVETDPGPCDGKGGGGATMRACGFYACGATACLSSCTTDAQCASTAYCDAASSCQPKGAKGTSCASDDQCSSGLACVDGSCCDDAQCTAHHGFCGGTNAGHCKPANGQSCAADSDCSSGHCADGVCCDTACSGLCETCGGSDSKGKCIPVLGAPAVGHGTCPPGTGDVCGAPLCDGKARTTCAGVPGGETPCAVATCTNGQSTQAQVCNGSGACPVAKASPCPNFRACADGATCSVGNCVADADCASGYVCDAKSGACGPKTAHCRDGDSTVSVGVDGAEQSCVPYNCDVSGSCKTNCGTSSDCAGGYYCVSSVCTAPGTATNSGGCALAAPAHGTSNGAGLVALAVAAVLASRRRLPSHRHR